MPAEDIRKFWEETRAALAEVKMDATVEPVEQSDVFTMEGRIKTRTIHRALGLVAYLIVDRERLDQHCTWRQLKRRLILQGSRVALPALERVRAAA